MGMCAIHMPYIYVKTGIYKTGTVPASCACKLGLLHYDGRT